MERGGERLIADNGRGRKITEGSMKRWAILIVVTHDAYQSGGGVSTQVVTGYPTEADAQEAAALLANAGKVSVTVFPYWDDAALP